MRITAIQFDAATSRFSITIDERETLQCDFPFYEEHDYALDEVLSEEAYHLLKEEHIRLSAYSIALRYAQYKPRTEKEVRQRLHREKLDPILIDALIEKLCENQLLDDLQYAYLYVEDRMLLTHWSKRKIDQKLYEKGIPSTIRQEALSLYTKEHEEEALEHTFKTQYAMRDLLSRKEYERTAASLYQKGFSSSLIHAMLQKVRKEQRESAFEEENF